MDNENRLLTTQQFGEAKRHSWRVKVINIDDGDLVGVGVILAFDKDVVRILDENVGVVWFPREVVAVYPAPVEIS